MDEIVHLAGFLLAVFMCGIAGFAGFEDKALLRKMTDAIKHRGPDDRGFFTDKNISLGMRRLSIIDVKWGKQPLHNEDGTVHVVYNGEIYNFLSLRQELEEKGHKFYTKSDTEVIVHLYEEHGDALVKKLHGMFAFALWDSKKKKLLLGRDRFGKKPLYYCLHGGAFYFASEIKSILAEREVPKVVDKAALSDFLTFRSTIGDRTMLKGIKKILPGHILVYKNGRISTRKYWSLEFFPENRDDNYWLAGLQELLSQAVKKRLMSEVPLGAYLSGGVDSSIVVALMSGFSEEPVKTFSVGFGSEFDETGYARQVAEYLGTDHREFVVEKDALSILPQVVWHMDDPVADPAAIPTYLLSKRAKRHVTVVLTGEGGDEIFAGYFQYKVVDRLNRSMIPRRAFGAVKIIPASILNRIFPFTKALGDEGVKRFDLVLKGGNFKKQLLNITSIFTENEKKLLGVGSGAERQDYALLSGSYSLNKLLAFDVKTELPNDLLAKVDRMTMAFSIEARAPYLDHALAEFAARMPERLKLNGMKDKYLLRKIGSRLLQKRIMERKKQNFFVPLHEWKNDIIKETENLCQESSGSRFFSRPYLEKAMSQTARSELYYTRQLWSILTFLTWHRIFIEGDGRKPR